MATDNVPVTGGSGYNVATHSITEDAATKQVQRVELNNSSGTEISTASNPIQVSLANTAANATAVKVDNSAVTQPVSATNLDIRDLVQTQDAVTVYGSDDGGTTKRIIKTDSGGAIQVDLEVANVGVTSFPDNEPFNVAQYGGAAVGATNAVHVQPGTAAVFQVQSNSANVATEATLAAVNAKLVTGTDIGDVTINNAAGAAAVNIQDGGNSVTVDNAQLSVVGTGTEATAMRVTIASDSTGVLSVDDNGGALTVDGTVTVVQATAASLNMTEASAVAIKTAVEVIDNAIAGTEMQVDVVAALPAGTNAIGKLLPPDIDVTAHTNYARKYYTSAGAVTDGIVWSPAAGKRWHVVGLHFQVSAAATVTFEDDKAGGDDPVLKGEYAANGGEFLVFPEEYPMASGEDAADLIVTTSAGNIYVTVVGYEI